MSKISNHTSIEIVPLADKSDRGTRIGSKQFSGPSREVYIRVFSMTGNPQYARWLLENFTFYGDRLVTVVVTVVVRCKPVFETLWVKDNGR